MEFKPKIQNGKESVLANQNCQELLDHVGLVLTEEELELQSLHVMTNLRKKVLFAIQIANQDIQELDQFAGKIAHQVSLILELTV